MLGGPFTGLPARALYIAVTKTLNAGLALLPEETREGREGPCIRCGRCAEHCPVALDPEAMWRMMMVGFLKEAQDQGLQDCISCGICSYVCPSRVPLAQSFAAYAGATGGNP